MISAKVLPEAFFHRRMKRIFLMQKPYDSASNIHGIVSVKKYRVRFIDGTSDKNWKVFLSREKPTGIGSDFDYVAYLANSAMKSDSSCSTNWTLRSIKIVQLPCAFRHGMSQLYGELRTKPDKGLAVLTRSLLKRCSEKLITFESELSANGFENNGILADFIWDTIKI